VKFHFSTVVWGSWHTGVYLDVNLPSLLTPGNLAAFAAQHDVVYRIFTSASDAEKIRQSAAYQAAERIVPFELIECPLDNVAQPIAMHHALWRRSLEEARRAGAMILVIPPDVTWSNGAFGHVAEQFAAGKRAVFMTYMRVISETCLPEIKRLFGRSDTPAIDAPSRALVDVMMRHIHPLTLTYLRNSENFPFHPEFILWNVPPEGMLMRVLVREMFALDPDFIHLNAQSLPAHSLELDKVHYVTDSDDLFALSFAPLVKDVEWYAKPQPLDPLSVGRWWLTYDSPANDAVASRCFYVHSTERTSPEWRRAELESEHLMRRLAGVRETLRALGDVNGDARLIASVRIAFQLAAFALVRTKLASLVGSGVSSTLLLPRDAALLQWFLHEGEALFRPENEARLVRAILDHVVLERIDARPGVAATVAMASGRPRKLTWSGKTPVIDGLALHGPARLMERHVIYIIDNVLPMERYLEESSIADSLFPRAVR
jgi:hypothetical protein